MDDFAKLQSSISTSLVSTTRTTAQLAAQDLSFHRSLDPVLGTSLDRQNERLLGLAQRLLEAATANSGTHSAPRLDDIEAVDNDWRAVVDVIDSLLERADTALDEFTGAVRRLTPEADASKQSSVMPRKSASAFRNQDVEKPQLSFANSPTNNATGSFKPLLLTKPHATIPLEVDLEEFDHPYRAEIEAYEYPNSIYRHEEPIPYHPFETTSAVFVDTEEKVHEMLSELKQAKEIAIDLEHHDQRSYIGIVSLMQISTRNKDWIVDTLKPWRQNLQCLNEVFADPGIIKVLHGAHMDAIWLQRDLGLYLVGLFDTHHASRVLGYPGGSLAYLLKRFVDIDAQKQYQMADWRIRPLPQELLDYARSDTHYLLYIFDCMRNELIEKSDFSSADHEGDKIWHVLVKSSETALQKYEHPIYDTELGLGPVGWYKMLARTSTSLTREQFSVFRAVHKWRDDVAREQDDSVHFVMPNHQIFTLAKAIPNTKAELLGLSQPLTRTVRLRADELLGIICQAKEKGSDGPEMMDLLQKVEPQYPRKFPREHPSTTHTTPVETREAAPLLSNTLSLRTLTSRFWGPAFDNSLHGGQTSSNPSVTLSVPLPPLNAEIFLDPSEIPLGTPQEESEYEPVADSPPKEEENDIFVLKEERRKRKRTDPGLSDGMAANLDEVALPDDEMDGKAEKKRAKAEARRARKAAKLSSSATGTPNSKSEYDDVPFDYTSVPSLLNPPRETRDQMKERRKKEKNPYAKSMDAPKGLPRVQKERAGKSMTFKK